MKLSRVLFFVFLLTSLALGQEQTRHSAWSELPRPGGESNKGLFLDPSLLNMGSRFHLVWSGTNQDIRHPEVFHSSLDGGDKEWKDPRAPFFGQNKGRVRKLALGKTRNLVGLLFQRTLTQGNDAYEVLLSISSDDGWSWSTTIEIDSYVADKTGGTAVAIAGGHVMVLLNRFRMYALMPKLTEFPVLAWAAGAMVLTERIVAFHDSPPQGRGNPEVLEAGVGLVPGVVVLPHARQRLKLTDPVRVALLARRFAPARCLAFDADCEAWWVDWRLRPGGGLRELRSQGDVLTLTPASDVGTRRP